jgi:hypothetical protein
MRTSRFRRAHQRRSASGRAARHNTFHYVGLVQPSVGGLLGDMTGGVGAGFEGWHFCCSALRKSTKIVA